VVLEEGDGRDGEHHVHLGDRGDLLAAEDPAVEAWSISSRSLDDSSHGVAGPVPQ
jgi:hypothetical protein